WTVTEVFRMAAISRAAPLLAAGVSARREVSAPMRISTPVRNGFFMGLLVEGFPGSMPAGWDWFRAGGVAAQKFPQKIRNKPPANRAMPVQLTRLSPGRNNIATKAR